MTSTWSLQTGDLIELDGGVLAEVMAPSEDGEWVTVVYRVVTDPEDEWLVGTPDAVHAREIRAARWTHLN